METLLRKYLWVIDLAVLALCAMFSARAAATMIESKLASAAPPPKPAARIAAAAPQTVYTKEYETILNRNVFCSTCPPILKKEELIKPGEVENTAPQRTTLPIALVAIMYAPTSKYWSVAIIRDTEAKTSGPFAIGAKIREATITDISETRVDLDVQGREEYLELFDKGPAPTPPPAAAAIPAVPPGDPLAMELQKGIKKTGEHNYEVQRGTVDSLLNNMSALSRAARIVPEIKDGHAAGFRLFSVRPDGPFALIGLQNGDVISTINGLEMNSPDQALMVYTKLKSANHLAVGIERNGQKITKEYNLR
jgi:general secretion pathway protein C